MGSGRRICGHLVMPHSPFFGLTAGGMGKLAYPWLPQEQHGPGAPGPLAPTTYRSKCSDALGGYDNEFWTRFVGIGQGHDSTRLTGRNRLVNGQTYIRNGYT